MTTARNELIERAQSAYDQLQMSEKYEKDHESGGLMIGSMPTSILVARIHENLKLAGGPGGPAVEVTVLQPEVPKEKIEEALFEANLGMLDKMRKLGARRTKGPFVPSGKYADPEAFLDAVMALPQSPYIPMKPGEFKPEEGREIAMDAAGVTNSGSGLPIIGTCGIISCVGVAVANRELGVAGLAHLAADSDKPEHLSPGGKEVLKNLLSVAREDPSQVLEVRLNGPYSAAAHVLIKDVLAEINALPNVRVLSADVLGKGYPADIAVDARRWDEGLIKGRNSSEIDMRDTVGNPDLMVKFLEGNKHRVDLTDLPHVGTYDKNGLFDARDMPKQLAEASGVARKSDRPR